MKILFATDGSPHALAALQALVDRLDRFRDPAEILLLHVHPPLPHGAAAAWVGKDAVARYYDEEGEAALAASRELLTKHRAAFTATKLVGDIAPTIVAHAEAGGCDFIAMGAQGHNALTNLVLGSVATKVVALSAIPVLLLK
jgi:nucleotide-binding universal stress UspA family protein